MSMLTANGAPVIAMQLALPVSGLWVASLDLDSEDEVDGELVIEQEGAAQSLTGTVLRTGVVAGLCRVEVVGGTGGLVGDIDARSYRNATARTVFEEILASSGEVYEATSTRSAMTTALPYWTRSAGSGKQAIWSLADILGAKWRVMPSGSVWMGIDSWPVAPEFEYTELDRDLSAERVLIAPETLDIMPGMQLKNGDRVGRIVYTVTRNEPLRATYSLET
jgi:hypothetical protein